MIRPSRFKVAIDAAMVAALPLLLAYALMGESTHERIGVATGVLFVTHLCLNRKWLGALRHGQRTPMLVAQAAVAALLALCMVATMATGIVSSRYLFEAAPFHAESSMLELVHMTGAYWGFALASIHLGMNAGRFARALGRRSARCRTVATLGISLVACYGTWAFVARGVWRYLLLLNHFAFMDLSQPVGLYLLDHLAIMMLFACVGRAIARLVSRSAKGKAA